jgi:uncharacterized protein YodC (DUF2158 family)
MLNTHGQDVGRSFPSDSAAELAATSSNPRQLQAGDRVRLMSGGAVMTVEKVQPTVSTPFAMCRWMDPRDKIQNAFITLDALERVDPEDQTPSTR